MNRRYFINLTGLSGLSLLVSFDVTGRIISRLNVPAKGMPGFALEKMLSDSPIVWSRPQPVNSNHKQRHTPNTFAQLSKTAGAPEVSFSPPMGEEYTVRANMNGANNQTDRGLFHEYTVQCDAGMTPELTFAFSADNPLPAYTYQRTENPNEFLVRLITPTNADPVSETLTVYFSQVVDGIDNRRNPEPLPQTVELLANYPNPFNNSTAIRFRLLRRQYLRIDVLDLLGRIVKTLYKGIKDKGEHTLQWDGRDKDNRYAASGIYILRLKAGETTFSQRVKTERMVMVK